MSARIMISVIKLAIERGHKVFVIAEGKAVGIMKEASIELAYLQTNASELPKLEFNPIEFMASRGIDIVSIGCSSPINWELKFAKGAHLIKTPVAAFADIWGAGSRLQGFRPELMVVIDEISIDIEHGRAEKFVVIGDPADETYRKICGAPIEDAAAVHVDKFRHYRKYGIKSVLVVGDNNDLVVDICRVAAESIRLTGYPEKFVVVPRLIHPKDADKPEVQATVHEAMAEFHGIEINHFDENGHRANTDWLAGYCEYTVTSYSTAGRIALHAGERYVSVQTPKCVESMQRELGLSSLPICDCGIVPDLRRPYAIDDLGWETRETLREKWNHGSMIDPLAALDAILALD